MTPSARIASVIEVLTQLYENWQGGGNVPMDRMLAGYFKQRRFIGSKDRGFISEMAYGILRHGGTLEWHIIQQKQAVHPRSLVLAALVFFYGQQEEGLSQLFSGERYAPAPLSAEEMTLIQKLAATEFEQESMPLAPKLSTPEWMLPRLEAVFGENFQAELTALNTEAPVDLRVNTLKCPDRAELIFALDKEGYMAMPTPHSPLGVRLKKRIAAFGTEAFKKGWFEMQDEGSQIAALLVEAEKGQKVIDFCAGAGGKTLAIAATMKNKGRILALDVHEPRLKELKKRLKRAGVDNVVVQPMASETDKLLKRHVDSADWVFVDAPCSGSGTWRRNPDLKWRLREQDLAELTALQRRILASARRLVKPGGKLIYVTCSIFREENASQISQFLMDYPDFRLVSPPKLWNSLCRTLGDDPKMLAIQLSPYQNNTDGFFAAILERAR